MSITASELTPADIAACTNGNRNDGGMWGGDWCLWIVLFLIFGMFGFGGFGGFGGGAGLQGMATRADINEGFALNNITGGIQAIQQGVCDSTYALNNTINGGFRGVDNAICNLGFNVQQGFNGIERGRTDVVRQIADAGYQQQRAVDGVNYNMAQSACSITNAINNSTRDIIDNQNQNSRAILDYLCQDKIATLQQENQTLRLAASQADQNAFLRATMEANTAEIIRRTGNDCPVPAYIVQSPTPISFPTNGCGQVQFGSGACCNY